MGAPLTKPYSCGFLSPSCGCHQTYASTQALHCFLDVKPAINHSPPVQTPSITRLLGAIAAPSLLFSADSVFQPPLQDSRSSQRGAHCPCPKGLTRQLPCVNPAFFLTLSPCTMFPQPGKPAPTEDGGFGDPQAPLILTLASRPPWAQTKRQTISRATSESCIQRHCAFS